MDVELEVKDKSDDFEPEEIAEPLTDRDAIAAKYSKNEYDYEEEQQGETDQDTDERSETNLSDQAADREGRDSDTEREDEEQELPSKVEVIVNGQRMMADKEKVEKAGGIENYQRNLASHLGLQELAKQRKLLNEEKQVFDEYVREKTASLPSQEPDDSKPPEVNVDSPENRELMTDYHEAIYEGDNARATELLMQLMQKGISVPQQPQVQSDPINRDELVEEAVQRVRNEQRQQQYQMSVQQARRKFAEEFSEIENDPVARQVANEKTKLIMQSSPDLTPEQIVMEAGKQTRLWMQGLANKSATQESKQRKIAAKEKQVTVPAGSTRSVAKPPPKIPTNSDYISELRRSRGLE